MRVYDCCQVPSMQIPAVVTRALFFGLVGTTLASAFLQTARQPGFEVASVKRSAPGQAAVRWPRGPAITGSGQAIYSNIPLRFLVTLAYEVQSYQVTGP